MDIPFAVKDFIRLALKEDIGSGDATTELLVGPDKEASAMLIAKAGFVLAGLPFVKEVFAMLDPSIRFNHFIEDGTRVRRSDVIAELSGRVRPLLAGERVALNILQHLSGIATLTNRFVSKVEGLKTKIVDTRKTMPGMRFMEKYAVKTGGGRNHRFALYDGILIKDNHIEAAGGIKKAIALAKEARHLSRVEVEVETLSEFRIALASGVDIVMLDNMSIKDIKEAVRLAKGKVEIEASGDMGLDKVRAVAEAGVDYISVGALTHSAPSVDISMKLLRREPLSHDFPVA